MPVTLCRQTPFHQVLVPCVVERPGETPPAVSNEERCIHRQRWVGDCILSGLKALGKEQHVGLDHLQACDDKKKCEERL